MLKFKKVEIDDIDIFSSFETETGELSCENAFVNLLVWQCTYNNMYAVCDGQLIIKSGDSENTTFRLPYGDNMPHGIELIREYCGGEYPKFWAQEGKRLEEFKALYGDIYGFEENRDAFDYIYSREALSLLQGKKYHGKRNHISAFDKKYNWHYSPITEENITAVKECAEKWYDENSDRADKYMLCEKNGINILLDNMKRLNVKGGAIYVEDRIVAFTLGSPINRQIFDIHIEKALSEFATAYTVINREFARNELGAYKYINREDDLGLEGLRKAKLSYKPEILLKKYSCNVKSEEKGL